MFVRFATVVNLEPLPQNQKTLEYIVRNEPTFNDVQEQAIRRITDKKILQRLKHSTTRNYIYSLTLEVEGIYKRPRNISEVKEKSNDKDYLLYVANCLGIDTDIQRQARIELFNMGYHHIEEDVTYTPLSRVQDRVMIDEGQKRIYLASPSNNSNF